MGWVKLFGDSTGRQNPKFQPGGLRSSAASSMAAGRGWDRIQGAVDSGGGRRGQGECTGSGHYSRSMHWCTTASRLVSCAQLGKASEPKDGGRPPIGPRHHCIFGHVPRKQPFLYIFNDRSATWIRLLIAI